MPVCAETYERVALEDQDSKWELWDGQLRQKPIMSFQHGYSQRGLAAQLIRQLPIQEYQVSTDSARTQRLSASYFVPDVLVIPVSLLKEALAASPDRLEVYAAPLPFIAEVWSPSTGEYDVDVKLGEYQRRGDHEIWRVHPPSRSVTIWLRQPDGGYTEAVHTTGVIELAVLPGVRVNLDQLCA